MLMASIGYNSKKEVQKCNNIDHFDFGLVVGGGPESE